MKISDIHLTEKTCRAPGTKSRVLSSWERVFKYSMDNMDSVFPESNCCQTRTKHILTFSDEGKDKV